MNKEYLATFSFQSFQGLWVQNKALVFMKLTLQKEETEDK